MPDFVREDELKTLLEQIEQAEGARKEELKAMYDELSLKSANASWYTATYGRKYKQKKMESILYFVKI